MLIDREGKSVFINPAGQKLLGQSQIGVPITEQAEVYRIKNEDGWRVEAKELPAAQAQAGQLLVQEGVGPLGELRVDGRRERDDLLGHAAGRRDHHHHHDLRLEHQHLDVADLGGLERRRGHERHQRRHLGKHLGGRAQRGVDLAPHRREVDRQRIDRAQGLFEQFLCVQPVAGVGGDAAGRRVRMAEQAAGLELGQLVADRRR